MAELKSIFEALMLEANSDMRSAKLLLDGAEFSRSIYHSQQAVEKAMKASLVLTGAIITDDHWISDRFKQVFPEMPDIHCFLIRKSQYGFLHVNITSMMQMMHIKKRPLF